MAATAIAPAQQADPQLEKAFSAAMANFQDANNKLQAEEKTLAAATAQFNEQCKLQAAGKKADPQTYRDGMTQIEHRIIGLRALVAERQAVYIDLHQQRQTAIELIQAESARERIAVLRREAEEARAAVPAARLAVKQAEDRERRAWRALSAAINSAPAAAKRI